MGPRADDPLVQLECVRLHVRRSDGRLSSEQVLEDRLRSLVAQALEGLRYAGPQPTGGRDEWLRLDFSRGNIELEAWSALHHYYLGPERYALTDIAQRTGTSISTLRKRRLEGYQLLAAELGRLEVAAARRLAELEPDRVALESYRRACVERWRGGHFQLYDQFVNLRLLLEQRGHSFDATPLHFTSLTDLLEAIDDTAVVLLGPPGSGKSTLLRNLELTIAERALSGQDAPLTFFVPLNGYRSEVPGASPPPPAEWLARLWSARNPNLPPLTGLLPEGRMLLLLDALNEMPHDTAVDLRRMIDGWRGFVQRLNLEYPGNRAVFTCRSLDYSAPLSSSALPVPQVTVLPFDRDQIREYLGNHLPDALAEATWAELQTQGLADVLDTPFLLSLFIENVRETGSASVGAASLLAGFVRGALRRELGKENPLLEVPGLVSAADRRRVLQASRWKPAHGLPDSGDLFRCLSDLAFEMLRAHATTTGAQSRIDYAEAIAILGRSDATEIVEAAAALGIVEIDLDSDEVLFSHQLVQEFFAARKLAGNLDVGLVRQVWRSAEVTPTLDETVESLAPAAPVPPLPSTGWEETVVMAVTMTPDSDVVIRGLMDVNLPLAGRAAGQPDAVLSYGLMHELRKALVARSQDPDADIRARIAAGEALGWAGDPRFEDCLSVEGVRFVRPPLVPVPAGTYRIGTDEPVFDDDLAVQEVSTDGFLIGRFPVTRLEYAAFIDDGGYDDPRWWDTTAARDWLRGIDSNAGLRENILARCREFEAHPDRLQHAWRTGTLYTAAYNSYRSWLAVDEQQRRADIESRFPDRVPRKPEYWAAHGVAKRLHPVSGVSWYEARAYCAWLSDRSGMDYRLPTEAEWAIAATLGADVDAGGHRSSNPTGTTVETHIRSTTPVGLWSSPRAQVPADMLGNVTEWVSTVYAAGHEDEWFAPGETHGGLSEVLDLPDKVTRISKGGSFQYPTAYSRSACRLILRPSIRTGSDGFRIISPVGDGSL